MHQDTADVDQLPVEEKTRFCRRFFGRILLYRFEKTRGNKEMTQFSMLKIGNQAVKMIVPATCNEAFPSKETISSFHVRCKETTCTYLEPVCPMFLGLPLSKKALSNQNNGHLGSRYIHNHSMFWNICTHLAHGTCIFTFDPRLWSRNHMVCQFRSKHIPMKSSDNLVGGWETQFQKLCESQNGKKSPQVGLKIKKYLKPPPSNLLIPVKRCPLDVSMRSVHL